MSVSRSTANQTDAAAHLSWRRAVAWLELRRRQHPGMWRRLGRRLLHALLVLVAIMGVALAAGAVYVATLPSVADAPARVQRILAEHHGTYGALPPPAKLGDALVSVEDEHFYDNFLINDLSGAGRAAVATLNGGSDPGGSTIPQQLAKLIYGRGTGVGATLREIGVGIRLSVDYSTAQVLNMYLNAAYFGNADYGYVAAAHGYFGTSPRRLDWAQAAMLAGLPQAPSAYDPLRHYWLAKQRQEHVLDQLVANHYLTPDQAKAAYREPLALR